MTTSLLPTPSKLAPARERLLHAALAVFSRDGLHAATTRNIAEEAGVNEVTLFRLFGTKDGLLTELMSHLVVIAMSRSQPAEDNEKWSGTLSLRENLRRFAKNYYALLEEGEAFIRTMVGEARRYPEHARKATYDAGKPLRDRFIANLEAARKAGKVRRGPDLPVVAEAFMDSLFSGMLRHTAGFCGQSTPEPFINTCADIFAAGLTP
jgi:AcrR family transcriptional regulator